MWILHCTLFTVLFSSSSCNGYAHKLPDNFKRCKQSDPKLNECLKEAVEDAFHKMMNGLPKLGIGPLNPLHVDDITISSSGAVSIEKMQFKNATFHGLKGTKVINYTGNLKEYKLQAETYTEEFRMEGDYFIAGKILVLPISGKGRANITISQVITKHTLIGEPVEKGGVLYMILKDYLIDFKPKRMSFSFENLFNGDKTLGAQMNKFMNENWEVMYQELKGPFEGTFGAVFKEVANRLFSKVPFDDIFLKD